MKAARLRVEHVSKRFGGIVALDDVSLSAEPGRVTGLIGQNGAGKTTLLDVIARRTPAQGSVHVGDAALHALGSRDAARWVARCFQQLRLFSQSSVLDNLMAAFADNLGESLWREIVFAGAVSRQREAFRAEAMRVLDAYGLADRRDEPCASLSYGLQKLLSLARAQVTRAPVLLLDEPTSGLSPESIRTVLGIIGRFRDEGRTVVLVEHDPEVMFAVCDDMVVMDQGKVLARGSPADIKADAQVRELYFGRGAAG